MIEFKKVSGVEIQGFIVVVHLSIFPVDICTISVHCYCWSKFYVVIFFENLSALY